MGSVGILNVGAGDTKLVFDNTNPVECVRAARIVKDMIRRGYALLVKTDQERNGKPVYMRAKAFDESTMEYIIADFDPTGDETSDAQTVATPATPTAEDEGNGGCERVPAPTTMGSGDDRPREESGPAPRGKRKAHRIPAASTRAVAVARTAGG